MRAMIPQIELELVTQAVDGELSANESRRLRRLLQSSEEARKLHSQLELNRSRLRQLTPVPVPPGLFQGIMARVGPRPVLAASRRPLAHRAWLPLATAASLFLAVGGVTLTYALHAKNPEVARHSVPPDLTMLTIPMVEVARNDLPPENGPLVSRLPEDVERPVPSPAPRVVLDPAPPPATEVAAQPRLVPPLDFLTSPLTEPTSPFETVQVRLPYLASLAEIKERSEPIVRELSRDPAYRLDLFARSPSRGMEMLLTTAKAGGVAVSLDSATQARLKKASPANYVIYIESLTPIEIRDLLAKLSAADGRLPKREFEMLHLASAQTAENRDLKELLGIDVGLWKRTDANPNRPITAGTGDAVAKAVATGIATRGPEKAAVALTFQPAALRTKPAASKELQQFLARRGARPAGSVSLMIVVRGI